MLKSRKKIEKVYYTIGEVAEWFDVNPSLIRYWEKEFDILKPKKNNKGNRLFTREDIDDLRLIYHLVKERRYTLQGARDKIKQNKEDITGNVEIVDTLNRVKEFLTDLKRGL